MVCYRLQGLALTLAKHQFGFKHTGKVIHFTGLAVSSFLLTWKPLWVRAGDWFRNLV